MAKKKVKTSTWYEQVFESLDFADIAKSDDLDIKTEPPWVVIVLRELTQQMMPALSFRKMAVVTPRGVGRYIGQQHANQVATAIALEKANTPENVARAKPFVEMLQKNENHPAVGSLRKAIEFMNGALQSHNVVKRRFNEVVLTALKVTWEQPNQSEAAAFFGGLAEGLSKPGIRECRAVRATTATPIYLRLFIHRRDVEKLNSVRELREFLLRVGMTEQVLGDPSRLEKLCGRIGLSFGKPGRKTHAK
jgi:hypothetical protein